MLGCRPFCTGKLHARMSQRPHMFVPNKHRVIADGFSYCQAQLLIIDAQSCVTRVAYHGHRTCTQAPPQPLHCACGADTAHSVHGRQQAVSTAAIRRSAAGSPRAAVCWCSIRWVAQVTPQVHESINAANP